MVHTRGLTVHRWTAAYASLALAALAAVLLYMLLTPPAAAQEGDTFSVSDVTVVEGGSADVTVTLSSAAPSGGVAFTAAASYATTGTGIAAEADVHSVASSLTIAQNGTSGTLAVRANKDTDNEGAETFTVTVTVTTSGWSAASGDNTATVTIHDPVRFTPRTEDPSASKAGIGVTPEKSNIVLYFKVGDTISVQFPAAHAGTGEGPYVYALGGPERFYQSAQRRSSPDGLTFDAATRTLSGTPTGQDGDGVTTLGSNRIMHYHVWDDSGEDGPDGDANTEDNHDELRVRIHICPSDSAAAADGATPCVKTAELYSLAVSHGDPATPVSLSPTFDRDTGTYSANVGTTVTAVDVSVLPEDLNIQGVTMTVNDVEFETDLSGRTYTGEASLNTGLNVIGVEVTSDVNAAHETGEDNVPIPVTKTYTVNLQRGDPPDPLTFGSATINDRTYTVGADVNQTYTEAPDQGLPKLPEAGGGGLIVTYTATGLPTGLSMGHDRVIRGTPTEATTGEVVVTYTADDGSSSVSLTFGVTVVPPVTFSEEAQKFINSRIIAWKSGRGWLSGTSTMVNEAGISTPTYVSTITFPTASGGHGTLTYSLLDNSSGEPLADEASGITFNITTRKLGGTPTGTAVKTWAVTYVAEDENGSRAYGYLAVYAGGYGGL